MKRNITTLYRQRLRKAGAKIAIIIYYSNNQIFYIYFLIFFCLAAYGKMCTFDTIKNIIEGTGIILKMNRILFLISALFSLISLHGQQPNLYRKADMEKLAK